MKKSQEIIKRDNEYILGTYAPLEVVFDNGDGCKLYDTEGKEYVDFLAGIAVCSLGHNHKKLTKAIKQQSQKLMIASNYFYTEPRGILAEKLLENTHFSKVFFTNSGAESNEAALKIAKKFFNKKNQGRYKIVTCLNSFHGRTIATVTATGQEKYYKPYLPMPDWFIYVPFNDKEALKKALSDPEVGALMLESIQGEGGVNPASEEYMSLAKKLTSANGQLLIMDEVQTGVMRTGKMYGYQHYKVEPDIITLAKGLGGGFPIGATLMTKQLADIMEVGDHGTTYGSNPLACSAALAVVSELQKNKMKNHIKEVSNYLWQKLKSLEVSPLVTDIKGKGLMLGIELDEKMPAKTVMKELLDKGVVASTAGKNTLRLVPPLIITTEEIDFMFDKLTQVLKEYRNA
ncbi:MAG: aspartate aminotransferase family protein [Bacillota bacterium]